MKPEQCPECNTPRPPIIYDRPDNESSWEYWLGCADCHATALVHPQPTTDLAIRAWNEWAISAARRGLVRDLTGSKCPRCNEGTLGEQSIHDDIDGTVRCPGCFGVYKRHSGASRA